MYPDRGRVRLKLTITLVGLLVAGTTAFTWGRQGQGPQEAIYILPRVGLSEYLRDELHLENADDHNIDLGGIGSDLFFAGDVDNESRKDHDGEYWMITDRGPNGEEPRTFPVPEFTPFILKVKAENGIIQVKKSIPITGFNVTRDGVTGLANLDNLTEPPALNEPFYNCFGIPSPANPNGKRLTPNPHGLDTEGLIRTREGVFWVVEEYGPSIVKIGPNGKVLNRFFPKFLLDDMDPITGYDAEDSSLSIPEIYGLRRRLNRGFEGIALSPDEKTLYIALQSPFLTPGTNAGRDSRNTRILAFDTQTERVTGEFVYQFHPFAEFNVANQPTPPFEPNRARDMKISALAMVDNDRMLILERTDFIAKVYLIDLRGATNILGTKWDDPNASSADSLEAVANLTAAGITPLKTSPQPVLVLDSTVPIRGMPIPQKIEGLTILNDRTVAIANDNDFGVGSFAVNGNSCTLVDTGRQSQILVIRLDQPLK